MGWRDDSVLNNIHCSTRRPRLDSQHAHQVAHKCLWLQFQWIWYPLPASVVTHMYIISPHLMYTWFKNTIELKIYNFRLICLCVVVTGNMSFKNQGQIFDLPYKVSLKMLFSFSEHQQNNISSCPHQGLWWTTCSISPWLSCPWSD